MKRGVFACLLVVSVAGELRAGQKKVPPPVVEGWRLETGRSPMDDSPAVLLGLLPPGQQWLPGLAPTRHPAVLLRCKEGRVEAIIGTGMAPNADFPRPEGATVRYRYDREEAVTVKDLLTTDGTALLLPEGAAHVQKMLQHERLVVEVTPVKGAPIMMAYDLHGLGHVIAPLQEACGLTSGGPRP